MAGAELDAAEALLDVRPETCPWAAFYEPDVRLVRWAASFFDVGPEHAWGEDPEWWLVQAAAFYRRALERAAKAIAEKPKPTVESKPGGGVRIRG